MIYSTRDRTNGNFATNINKTAGSGQRIMIKAIDFSTQLLPAFFVIIVLGLDLTQTRYNMICDTVSQLVLGNGGWIATILFLLSGLILVALSFRIGHAMANKAFSTAGSVAVSVMGIGFLIIAFFPTQDPGSVYTIAYLIHKYTAYLLATLFPITVFLIWCGSRKEAGHKGLCQVLITIVLVALILDIGGIFAFSTDAPWKGAIERLIILNGLVWLQVIGLHLLNEDRFDERNSM